MTDRTATTDLVTAQIAADPAQAALTEADGRWVLTMTRELAHPPERVWPMLTQPEQLSRWSPVVPDRPLTSPGPALARENPGDPAVDVTVVSCDPPRELVHHWGGHLLRWVVTPVAGGSRLTLEQTFDQPADAAMYAAGWHLCLAVLILAGRGPDVDRIVGERARDFGWAQLRDRYQASLG
ncbi:MAG TPA: SRPBCC family protein [Streptosporangiaceae bacterium]|jgi:uncharacterized protein YndB with AHSA1/START domain